MSSTPDTTARERDASLSACILAALSERESDELMFALVRRQHRGGSFATSPVLEACNPGGHSAAGIVVEGVTKRVWCTFAALLTQRFSAGDTRTDETGEAPSVGQPLQHGTLVCDVGLYCRETFYACLVESVCLCVGKSFCLFRPDDPPVRLARLEQRRRPRCKLDTDDVAALLRDAAATAQRSCADVPVAVVSDNAVAYYMYTSGSTGDPKCVVASRRNLRAYLQGFVLDKAGLTAASPHCRFFCLSSPFFDPSIGDMLVGLCTAHGVFYTCTAGDVLNGEAAALLASVQPTHVVSTPAVWLSLTTAGKLRSRLAVDAAPRMKVFLGGERMSQELIDAWAGDVELHNIYGVTEATIYQSVRRVLPGAAAAGVTCGPGVGPKTIRIRGVNQAAAAVASAGHREEQGEGGIAVQGSLQDSPCDTDAGYGEVVLYGEQVCCGYAEDAADAPSPFGRDPMTGERFFATGDVGRLVQGCDGEPPQLELRGRRDWQMKVNGQRVGLEEVEGTVQRAMAGLASPCACFPVRPAVSGAAASIGAAAVLTDVVRADLLREHHDGVVAALQELLGLHLPAFMIPRRWVLLPRGATLPQTPTGKVSRTQLALSVATGATEATPEGARAQDGDEAGALRQVVQTAWEATLGVPVRPDTHYVHAGGDSLGALKLTRAVYVGVHGGSDAGIDEHGGLPFPFQPCVLLQHPRFDDYVQALRAGWSTTSPGSEGLPPPQSQSSAPASTLPPHLSPAEAHADHLLRSVVAVRGAALAENLLRHGLVQVNGHNTREHRCITPLHVAVASSSAAPEVAEEDEAAVLRVVEVLLRHGAKLTTVTPDGVTPAHVAAAGAPVAVLQRLLDHDGAAVHCRDGRQQSLLHFAARSGRAEAVCLLLARYRLPLEVRDKWQRTPVHWAVLNGHVAVLQAMAAHVASEANGGGSDVGGVKRCRGGGGGTARFTRLARKKTYLAYETLRAMAQRVCPADDVVRQLCDALAPWIGEAPLPQ